MSTLVLGPVLRHVDETSATIWVETADAAAVRVVAGEHVATGRTFAVHGHHYALVDVEGLAPGSVTPYTVEVDGRAVWPPTAPSPGARLGPSVLATLDHGRPLRLAFGSCRVSVAHDEEGHGAHGVDALRAYALHLAGVAGDTAPPDDDRAGARPDLLLFLGDQVYADETTEEMREFIRSRRDPAESPWYELADYEEYAHLYRLAWTEPAIRWLLSTVPSAMIFDDHDIRDDWNTSATWRREMEATDWWHDRVVAGLGSYWVHQHLGNLPPAARREDALWRRVAEAPEHGPEPDLTEEVDALAARADQAPDCYRWSFARELGPQARLVVVDSRAARVLRPDRRSILDDSEMAWLDEQLRGGVEHLLVGTSLPYLLAPALHHAEAVSEALAEGRFGRVLARLGERLRQAGDLEHWAAFQDGFVEVAEMVLEVASGARGTAPRSVTFLSGDVHHSYVAEGWAAPGGPAARSRVVQAVCSPIRNPLPPTMRMAMSAAARGKARPTGRLTGGRTPRSPLHWQVTEGPWYDNNVAVLETRPEGLEIAWWCGEVVGGDVDRPVLRRVAGVDRIG